MQNIQMEENRGNTMFVKNTRARFPFQEAVNTTIRSLMIA